MTHGPRASLLPCFLFLSFHLLHPTSCVDPISLILQDLNCSTPGNYTATSAYAANVNQFLATLPENAVDGFYSGTVGEGLDIVYGLAMCPADYSRADCSDCLAGATAVSNADSLLSRCPGSTTVLAMFERCLIRYSDVNFFGAPEIGVVKAVDGETLWTTPAGPEVAHSLKQSTDDAILVPQRFAANSGAPFVLVQCTWDLSADMCKQCLNELTANATAMFAIKTQGQRKSYSCSVRYSNTSFMVVPFSAAQASAPTARSMDPRGTSTAAGGGHGGAMIMGVVVLVLILMVVIWSIVSWCIFIRTRDSFGSETAIKRFEYRDLCIATDWFSEKNKIGEGGFGMVYKGSLKKEHVAVKRIDKDSRGNFKDFLAELVTISQTGHRNVVRLKGWCCSISNFMFWWSHKQNVKLFLIYELVTNGNLHYHLHESKDVLPWEMRYKIAKGIGTALHYLHHECSPYILHRDIKPDNILLDNEFNAKLGDFGLSRVAKDNNHSSQVTGVTVGTLAYMDPLLITDGDGNLRLSSDVYSFGVVLLEIAHGKNCPDHVRMLAETFMEDIPDKKLAGQFDKAEMERVIVLGLCCCDRDKSKRPSMVGAIKYLENGGELWSATPEERHDTAPAPAPHIVTFS